MGISEYILVIKAAIDITNKIAEEVKKKKQDDGKVSEEEAVQILTSILDNIVSLIKPFIREN